MQVANNWPAATVLAIPSCGIIWTIPKGCRIHPILIGTHWHHLIAAGGMVLTGEINFLSARIGFILMAALAPLVTASLAYRITQRRQLALIAGFLAIFSGYYLPFIVTTDNYSVYMLLGALYFLALDKLTLPKTILLGLLAGFINLARGDGLLWLPLTLFAVIVLTFREAPDSSLSRRILL